MTDRLPGELRLGPLRVDVPVVLAPMAGITNAAYRRLCREQAALRDAHSVRSSGTGLGSPGTGPRSSGTGLGSSGTGLRSSGTGLRSSGLPGLFVCEMITSRGIVERDETTMKMLTFDETEDVRSVQLYGTDPSYVAKAAEILCAEYGVAHIDLNFGCPVPKVTRKGGGGALPWKRRLLGEILTQAVRAAEPYGVPVTMKTRKGIDAEHLTYLDAGRIAQESGCAAIALHGRTVDQAYSGTADWDAIGELVAHVDIPVLGNGDIWEASDAVRMVRHTGAAGVVVGRGCLGRPWLFRDLAAAFPTTGEATPPKPPTLPTLGEVAAMMRRHAELLSLHMGEERGCKEFRKHVAWYLRGFAAGGDLRNSLALVSSLAALDTLLGRLDPDEPFPVATLGTPRGRQGSPRRVVLPYGWLDDADGMDCAVPEDMHSGG